jgi:hypothetical protein
MARNSNLAVQTEVEDKFVDTTNGKYDEAAANAVEAPTIVNSEPPKTEEAKVQYTEAQIAILASTNNKSTKIRGLLATGMKRGAVASALGIRYQHVRNVELMPIKRAA